MKKLIISILLPFSAAIVGSLFTSSAIETWYTTLTRPSLAPPNWIFGPVWTLLYLLMGISFYLIWKNKSALKKLAIKLFLVQMVLNVAWSPLFFGAHQIRWALVLIIFLDIFVALTIWQFQKIDKRAAWLLCPYLAWILFASYLNYQFFLLN